MFTSVVEAEAPAVVRLRQAATVQAAAEAAQAQALLDLAAEAEWDDNSEFDMVGTRPIRIGADGTRLVDEHLPLEVAAALGISATAAVWLIRDVLNVAARHPRLWHAVQTRQFPLWRARAIAQVVEAAGLDRTEALQVDREIAPALGRVGWRRLGQRLRAAMLHVAPERLRTQAGQSRAARYVRVGALPDDPASGYLAGRLDTATARDFDDLLDRLADGLAAQGEDGDRDLLRARAIGAIAADPSAAAELLRQLETPSAEGSERRAGRAARGRKRHPHQFYIHLPSMLSPDAVAEVEALGPVLADQLAAIVGDRPIKITPVLRIGGAEPVADSYGIPRPIREHVRVRDRYDIFPYGTQRARSCDLDHTSPFVEGNPGQTRPSNLGPLARRGHRAKTHGGWRLSQPGPGVFWWSTPRGQNYRVGPDGTTNFTPGDPIADCSDAERELQWQLDLWRGS
ncbi:MAG: hypothetical protein QM628_10460 [Propionicimonas sp.]